MSHSSHYNSFTIHYDGDFSGPYTINNSKRDENGEVIENKWNSSTYICMEVKGGFNYLVKLAKKAIFDKHKQFKISGVEEDTNKRKSFLVDTDDVLDFIIEKEKFETISKIENMDNMKFFKKYISLGLMNWAIGVNIEK